MTEIQAPTKLEFRPITPDDRTFYENCLAQSGERGCEYSFANIFLWGRQNIAVIDGHIVPLYQSEHHSSYVFPIGCGNTKAVIDAILADAKMRGIPCRIIGLRNGDRDLLEKLYPGRFGYTADEGSFDYVYAIDDLADLGGKKYHGKRNHMYRFHDIFPDCTAEALDESNLPAVRRMTADWYAKKNEESPDVSYQREQAALENAFRYHRTIGMDGLVLKNGDDVLAFTLGSRISADTVDVHFEKARADAVGAYAAINCKFARYIREKYPDIRFLNREEDMGIEGLRRAKQSYHPHHMIDKYRAYLLEEGYAD